MADDTDGIDEAFEGAIRLAVMAGARLGAELARARQERLRQQQASDQLEARRLGERLEAEKRVAVAELDQVHRPDWWDRADAQRIGQTYATATAWAPESAEAARAERRMRDELQSRYSIDLDRTDPGAVTAEVEAWRQRLEQQRREEAAQQRTGQAADEAEAAALVDQATREQQRADQAQDEAHDAGQNPWLRVGDQDGSETEAREAERDGSSRAGPLEQRAEERYDSAERRAAAVRDLEEKGIDSETAVGRMRADTGAAKPATLATAGAGQRSRAPEARNGAGRGTQAERAGVER